MQTPDPALRRAFLSSAYGTQGERVWLAPQADAPAPGWAAGTWGIVTAWNPAGQPSDPAHNQARQAELQRRIAAGGWTAQPGINGAGEWQEPTFIIASIGREELAALGRTFGQAAVLHGRGARAELLWLDESGIFATDRCWLCRVPPESNKE